MGRFVDRCQVAAVGFFSDPASKEAAAFTAAADTNDEINFGLITDKTLFAGFDITDDAAVILLKGAVHPNDIKFEKIKRKKMRNDNG